MPRMTENNFFFPYQTIPTIRSSNISVLHGFDLLPENNLNIISHDV